MSIYSKRMAYTYASLGLLWLSPFVYWSIRTYLPDSFYRFIHEQEAALTAIYFGLAVAIFLFGKAWAYWGQASHSQSEN